MNHLNFTKAILLLSIPVLFAFLNDKKKDILVTISLVYIFLPFFGYIFLPVTVNPWHLGGEMAVSIILVTYLFKRVWEVGPKGKMIAAVLGVMVIYFAANNIFNFFTRDFGKTNNDPSLYRNEIAAVDFVYQYANGKNFKAYSYLPSVYDYPYQYLFWWYGRKIYGYIPGEYVYSPNKPAYISNQDKFQGSKENFSGLVFLIKEPDRIQMRQAWENDYQNMELISKKILGSIEVEVRREKL